MKLPKIDIDDLMLFGSLALVAVGAALVTAETTGSLLLAFGVLCVAFGLPTAVVAFLAAAEVPT